MHNSMRVSRPTGSRIPTVGSTCRNLRSFSSLDPDVSLLASMAKTRSSGFEIRQKPLLTALTAGAGMESHNRVDGTGVMIML